MKNQSRINLLKEVKTAVNTASFSPTEGRIKEAKALVSDLMSYVESLEAPKAKSSKKKRKQRKGKATPSTKVADRQEKAFHGRPDTPVTPRKVKHTASVEEARKSAQEVSDKSGATARAKRRTEAVSKALTKEAVASPADVTPPSASEARMADLEAKIEALLALQAMGHVDLTSRNENEVLFSDLPFDPTSTL
ncbi:MAG: hypothetical protein CMI60_15375 [Parvibaculum sp.]|nr:hypothetical protein [Parvibaculum sp.]